jgi:hypothetical protein
LYEFITDLVSHDCLIYHLWYRSVAYITLFTSVAPQPLVSQGLLSVEAARSHSDTPHCVGLLGTSDSEISTWKHTTLTTARHPCTRLHSNPQSQQASDSKPPPKSARLPGSALKQPSIHPSMALQPLRGIGLPHKTPPLSLVAALLLHPLNPSSCFPLNHIRPSSSWSSHWSCGMKVPV